jgi:hypothetical protein
VPSPQDREANDPGPGGALVQVAFGKDRTEAELIHGLLENAGIPSLLEQAGLNVDGPALGFGLAARGFGGGPQRVMVRSDQAERARSLLAETLVADEEASLPDLANAKYLEANQGGRARDYGVVGAYGRAILWSVLAMAVVFGVFLLLRGV